MHELHRHLRITLLLLRLACRRRRAHIIVLGLAQVDRLEADHQFRDLLVNKGLDLRDSRENLA